MQLVTFGWRPGGPSGSGEFTCRAPQIALGCIPALALFPANTHASATPTVYPQARSMPITSSNRSIRVRNLDAGTSKDAVETFAKTLAQTGSGKKVDSPQTPVSTALYNLCACVIAQLKQQ
jgi:hypothetical protein